MSRAASGRPHVHAIGPAPGAGTLVLIHGAGHDHSVWSPLARHLARHGLRVLAPDLPAHGRSPGPALPSVEALAAWLADWMAKAGVGPATLVGHSMGSLVVLETAARAPEQASGLVLIGTACPMPVAPALLEASLADPALAFQLINAWSFSTPVQFGNGVMPGFHLPSLNLRLMERLAPGVLHADLTACNAYELGLEAASAVRCPTLLLSGSQDQMTPARALDPLRAALCQVLGGARMISVPGAGHNLMAEAPAAVQAAIRGFLHQQ